MERELKLDLAAADAAALARAPELALDKARARRLAATYHDTAEGDLRRAGVTLRVRDDGRRRVQTVKAEGAGAAGLFVRPEWEREVADAAPVVDAAAGPVAALVGDRPLLPRFATDVRRRARRIEWEGARIDVALDTGEVRAGDVAEPIAELELELVDGPVPALFALARALDRTVPLRLGVRAKSERGHRLADGAVEAASKAGPVAVDRDGDAATAFSAVAAACLRQFRLNEARLLDGDQAAAPLHQARVALRRLRTALSLFRPLLAGDPRLGRFAAELRELAGLLGRVRDVDVLLAGGDEALRPRLAEARAARFAAVRARLEASATRRLMLDLAEWLAVGEWRVRPADPEAAREEAVPFAAALLDRRRRRLKRRGRGLAGLDDEARHRVRIEAKKLRYAAEFFGGLWTGKKARRRAAAFADAIEALQDELGRLNDLAHAPAVLAELGLPAAAPAAKPARDGAARAEAALERLLDVKRFWR